ncbi:hypothetical protein [Eudoraea chungangensis]|uniref:hypothetical protein n=1 Tax=Eudoraea chungangensis TaxID=1481905 RepID=UPI0023EC5CB4|nr:hypothetical protein [Eudoraea chungangensis]
MNRLIKGGLLFLAFGLLILLGVLGVEYFFWLSSMGRLVLFAFLVGMEFLLLWRYILVPLFYITKLKKGISDKYASLLIGRHFSEIGDRLYNLLELAENDNKTELLQASIIQRSEDLRVFGFTKAIQIKDSLRSFRYVLIPVFVLILIWLSGSLKAFTSTYERVLHYDLAYEPPAPFQFRLLTEELSTLEKQTFALQVYTTGTVKPEEIYIELDDNHLLLTKKDNYHEFIFVPPFETQKFSLIANNIQSKEYELVVLKVPTIEGFEIELDYPDYTGKADEIVTGTGNALIPEGTSVHWKVVGINTDEVSIVTGSERFVFEPNGKEYALKKTLVSNLEYSIEVSNRNAPKYEKLAYQIETIKDDFPVLKVTEIRDTLNAYNITYELEAQDDYLINSIVLKYFPSNSEDRVREVILDTPRSNYRGYDYVFPSGLELDEGQDYSYYFEVSDNDGVNGSKKAKSKVFTTRLLSREERVKRDLETNEKIIDNWQESLKDKDSQEKELDRFNSKEKENSELDYNTRRELKELLKEEEIQEARTEKLSRDLRKNLEDVNSDNPLNKLLQERLEREELEAKRNKELLKELEKVADKISKEELTKKLEEVAKKQQNSNRNLKQILELTKKYYVTEKAAQLSREFEKLSEEQIALSAKKDRMAEMDLQKKLSDKFKELSRELEGLTKDDAELNKPIGIENMKELQDGINKDQRRAMELMEKQGEYEEDSSPEEEGSENLKQKSAGEKLKELSKSLESSSSDSSDGMAEDAQMLRQILENLLEFSLEQERLYDRVKITGDSGTFQSANVKKQSELRGLFEHVDDSLFALSLRRAELSEFVNEQITDSYYNMEKSLEMMSDNKLYQAAAYQQYTINASNSLADFLANVLDNMQMSMKSGAGSGESKEGFQLPDIIQGQSGLNGKMKQLGKEGKEGSQGDSGKEGNAGKNGNEGGSGGKGNSGKDGQEGNEGEGNKGGKSGQNGKGGDGQGNSSKGKTGSGNGGENAGEEEGFEELFEIYKEQELIKNRLEEQLEDMMNPKDKEIARKVLRQMEQFQKEILEQGYTSRTMNRANYIEHELLKLEDAAMKQGKKQEREAVTSRSTERNSMKGEYGGENIKTREIELLMRQALPLQQFYQKKVRDYFQINDRISQ